MIRIIEFIEFNIFLNYLLLNYMIQKINVCKIKHQSNIATFICDHNNSIKSKSKQIMKTDQNQPNMKE